jgi:hypothetical protein
MAPIARAATTTARSIIWGAAIATIVGKDLNAINAPMNVAAPTVNLLMIAATTGVRNPTAIASVMKGGAGTTVKGANRVIMGLIATHAPVTPGSVMTGSRGTERASVSLNGATFRAAKKKNVAN